MGQLAFGPRGRYTVADGSGGAPIPRNTSWKLDSLGNWPLTRRGGQSPQPAAAGLPLRGPRHVKGWSGGSTNLDSVTRTGDFNNDGRIDTRLLHHQVNQANEIVTLYEDDTIPPPEPATALVYDP